MAYKFLRVAKNPSLNMIQVEMEAGAKGTWLTVQKTVYEWAKKNFQEGDDVEFESYKDKAGKVHVKGLIKKVGGSTNVQTQTEEPEPTPTATTPQPNPVVNTTTTKTWGKTAEESASIKRQAIGHMTSRSLIALQGHLDPNNIYDIARELYKTYQELVG